MKFERVLTIYWTKGFLNNGVLTSFSTPAPLLLRTIYGWDTFSTNTVIKRFEVFNFSVNHTETSFSQNKVSLPFLNLFFSQSSSVNNKVIELNHYFLLKLLLIKTTRGRAHALGKPSRGQRTWSNAWTSYNTNKTTRAFVSKIQKILTQEDKKNKRGLQKSSSKSLHHQKSTKNWF